MLQIILTAGAQTQIHHLILEGQSGIQRFVAVLTQPAKAGKTGKGKIAVMQIF